MKKNILFLLLIFVVTKINAQTEINDILSKLKRDIYNGSVRYIDPSSPNTTYTKAFYIYLIKPNTGNPYLMARFQYSGMSPIGAYGYNVMPDKHSSYNITPPTGKIIRESNDNSDFRSYCDLQVGDNFLNILRQVVNAENPKIEYLGTEDNLTVKISKQEVRAISNVLDAYDALK